MWLTWVGNSAYSPAQVSRKDSYRYRKYFSWYPFGTLVEKRKDRLPAVHSN